MSRAPILISGGDQDFESGPQNSLDFKIVLKKKKNSPANGARGVLLGGFSHEDTEREAGASVLLLSVGFWGAGLALV